MARQGELCGALTGGVLGLGLIYGRDRAEDKEAKDATYAKTTEFMRKFVDASGALHCRDLIGLDLSTDEGMEEFHVRNLREETCSSVVSNATRAVLELLDQ